MADDKKTSGTDYMVLWRADDGVGWWEELGIVRAASDSQAKAKGLATWKPEGGWVVTSPMRSWKPEDKKPVLSFR